MYSLFLAPSKSNDSIMIHVVKNESITTIASQLKEDNAINSSTTLKILIKFFNSSGKIARGDYKFDPHESVLHIALQIAQSHHNVDPIRVTFKEGATNTEMASTLTKDLPNFDSASFLALVNGKQGYLFPDTYFFFPLSTPEEIVETLSGNFDTQIAPLKAEIASSGKPESDIIIMASIIEKEAHGQDDNGLISGILWKRIANGMPLQVDAAPSTYKQKGLPLQPISNPGIQAIEASLHPIASPYLFYLHDKNGMVHFATTYSEHERNIARYLQ